MANRPGPDGGTHFNGPLHSVWTPDGQRTAYRDLVQGWNPRARVDNFTDFTGSVKYREVTVPIISVASNAGTNIIPGSNTNTATATVRAPVSGTVVAVSFVGTGTGTAISDTNKTTFTMLNLLGAGTGSVAILAASPDNATISTGNITGAIVSKVPYALNLHATAANARVAEGDILQFTSTTAGTVTVIDNPMLTVRFAYVEDQYFKPIISRIAGSPLVGVTANTLNGDVTCQFSSTNELQAAGFTYGDQLCIPMSRLPMLEAYLSVGTVTTAQSLVVGFATAFNTTLASHTKYVWFRLNASLVLVTARKDGTTTTTGDATVPSTTLTAGTFYLFGVDLSTPGVAKFFLDGNYLGSLTHAFAVTDVLQPIIMLHKASGTGTIAMNADSARVQYNRL